MRAKIESITRHFLTGAAALVVDMKLLSAEDAETAVRLLAAFVAIVVSRVLIWVLGKVDFLKFFKGLASGQSNGFFTVGLLSIGAAVAAGWLLPSCSHIPSEYKSGAVGGYYRSESGAKAGLEYDGEGVRTWVRLPRTISSK